MGRKRWGEGEKRDGEKRRRGDGEKGRRHHLSLFP